MEGNAITGGSIGGNQYGPTGGTSSASPAITKTAGNNRSNSGTQQTYKKIDMKRIDQNKNRLMSTMDLTKQDPNLTPDKTNSAEYVNNLANNILAGKNIHPTHLNELAGVLEANPEAAKDLKMRGISSDLIKNSYLKPGNGLQGNVNQDLENRYKNIFR